MNEKILVVDDEPKIIRLARDYLEKNGFQVVAAGDGKQALAAARREKPDLIILDLMLPRMDGWDVCRVLRRESDVPIIMLTARTEESDQLIGLELGADDYIHKPFSPRALVARVRAVLRRVQGDVLQPKKIAAGGISIDLDCHQVEVRGDPVDLTRSEFTILAALTAHPGQPLSRETLLEHLHGTAYDGMDRSVDSHIKNLRSKIEQDPSHPRLVLTVYGLGYKLSGEES